MRAKHKSWFYRRFTMHIAPSPTIKLVVMALSVVAVILLSGCASTIPPAQQTSDVSEILKHFSPSPTVPACPDHPTGLHVQLAPLPGQRGLHLRVVGLVPGETLKIYSACWHKHGGGAMETVDTAGPDGVLTTRLTDVQDCWYAGEDLKCVAVLWPVGMREGKALACVETTVPACWTKEVGMYCVHLGLCVALGTLMFVLTIVALLWPGIFKASGKRGRNAVAIAGALATLVAAHCFDCANKHLELYTSKTFNIWPHILSALLFELMVAALVLLLLRFLLTCARGDRVAGWVLLIVGGLLVSLIPLYLAFRINVFGIGYWALSSLTPDKMLFFASGAVAVAGLVSLLARGGDADKGACNARPGKMLLALIAIITAIVILAEVAGSAIAYAPRPASTPERNLVSLKEVQDKADFHVLVPAHVPHGYKFVGASIENGDYGQSVTLAYKGRWLSGSKDLHVWEHKFPKGKKCVLPQYFEPKLHRREDVKVRGHDGVYMEHPRIFPFPRPTELDWCEDNVLVVISGFESKDHLLEVAQSMK